MNPVNPKISALVAHFDAHYNGNPWYGDSLITILDEVDSTHAFWQPKSSAHCIAQIVAHIIYWRMALIKKMEGDGTYKPSMQSEDNWKDISRLKKLGWKKLNTELAASQKKLIDLLSSQQDTLLRKKYSEKATYEVILHGILQHDIYHIGQIAYLKSLAKSK